MSVSTGRRRGCSLAWFRARGLLLAGLLVGLLGGLLVCFLGASPAGAQLAARAMRDGAPVAALTLVAERIAVRIDRQVATTTLRQAWRNGPEGRVEGSFTFRAGDGANVAGFAYWNGDQKIVGEVLERGAAKAIYETTVSRRADPGLLEKSGEGTFSFRIFPIEPGETKRVELEVEQWLDRRDRVVEYRLPIAHARAEIDLAIEDPRRIRKVRSPSHHLSVRGEGTGSVRVEVGDFLPIAAPRCGLPAQELVLQYELGDGPFEPSAWVHRDAGHAGYFTWALAAPAASLELGQDLTLVVDGSPGEGGEQARRAADRMIERARASDRLNVVVTGPKAGPVAMLDRPAWATAEVRARARAGVDRVAPSAHVGDLAEAVAMAIDRQEISPRSRTLVILTGQAPSTRELAGLVAKNGGRTRIFTVGFGASVNRASLARLASESRGRFLLVESAAALPERIDRLARQIAVPVLVDLQLSAEGAEIELLYPRTLPDLYLGQELRVVGRIRGEGKAKLVLRGRAGKEVKLVAPVDLALARRPGVARSWGRERIAHLLEDIALEGESPARVDEAIELALAYDVVTPYTAFLAIPESELRADTAQSLAQARQQKLALLRQHPDATSALAGTEIAGGEPSAGVVPVQVPLAPPAPPSGGPPDASAPPTDDLEVRSGGGCAACAVAPTAARSESPSGLGWGLMGMMGVALLARRSVRRSSRGVVGSRGW